MKHGNPHLLKKSQNELTSVNTSAAVDLPSVGKKPTSQ